MDKRLNVLLVSPYHGGSHRAWANGYLKYSRHQVSLLTLPGRFWKWRMHGGAVTLARRFLNSDFLPQLVVATDMLDLTTFLALTRNSSQDIPVILYMHENQLTYPLPLEHDTGPMRRQKGERDLHYAFINFASMMAADRIFFNSHYHLRSVFEALPAYLKGFPEYNELGVIRPLRAKSSVLPVGVDFHSLQIGQIQENDSDTPLIIWNQRWEYDKNPRRFSEALIVMDDEGIPFRVALCGQNFSHRSTAFDATLARLSAHIVHVGYANDKVYSELLWRSDITVSTAEHEFFGISILEAIYCQTFPILPGAMSYPELIPEEFYPVCFYNDQHELLNHLRWALTHREQIRRIAAELSTSVASYDWRHLSSRYDRAFQSCLVSR